MKLKILLVILLIIVSCQKKEPDNDETLRTSKVINTINDTENGDKQTNEISKEGYFLPIDTIEKIDINELPELKMKIFGIGGLPSDIPVTKKKLLYYSNDDNNFYLMNYEIPNESMSVTLLDPDGTEYKRDYLKINDDITLWEEDEFTGEKYERPVIVIHFNNQAYLPSGMWKVLIQIDNNIHLESEFELIAKSISVVSYTKSNPLLQKKNSQVYKSGDHIYIYGNYKKPNTAILFAFYNLTKGEYLQDGSGDVILKPELDIQLKTDANGKFQTQYIVGNDLTKGEYKIAFGEKLEQVVLFGVYFQLK